MNKFNELYESIIEAKSDSLKRKFNKLFFKWNNDKPKDIISDVLKLSDDDLKLLSATTKERKDPKDGSPRQLQIQIIDKELEKRKLK